MYIKLWRLRLYISVRPTMTKHATGYSLTRNGHGQRAARRQAAQDAWWEDFRRQIGAPNALGDD